MSALVDTAPEARTVVVGSTLLGTLTVPRTQVFAFPHGVFGFPDAGAFALVPTTREGVFWFQCIDHEALTFLLVDPFRFVAAYSVDLGPQELGEILPDSASDVIVLCILTLPREAGEPATANLQGPIALNVVRSEGRQVVLQDAAHGTRHPIDLSAHLPR